VAGGILRLAPMTALARCVCEIDGMAEGQVWAASILRSVGSNTPTSHCGKFELDPDKTFTI
jgi:hypothetical protein